MNSRQSAGLSWSAMMAVAAILIAGAGLALQEWRTATGAEVLQAEIAALTARLEAAERDAGLAQQEAARLSGEMAGRLATLESAMPEDPQAALTSLAAAQEALIQRLELLESAPAPAMGTTGDTEMALAQSALTVASAMLADSLSGGDAARWLPVLTELRAAGLDLQTLPALRDALSPPPPSTSQLLAKAAAMMPQLRDAVRVGTGGWWSSTADRLAGFVTFRRQGETDMPAAADSASPLAGFEVAISGGRLEAALAASEDLAAVLPDQAGAINAWRSAATRRLAADAALAGFSADMAARLARLNAGGKAG